MPNCLLRLIANAFDEKVVKYPWFTFTLIPFFSSDLCSRLCFPSLSLLSQFPLLSVLCSSHSALFLFCSFQPLLSFPHFPPVSSLRVERTFDYPLQSRSCLSLSVIARPLPNEKRPAEMNQIEWNHAVWSLLLLVCEYGPPSTYGTVFTKRWKWDVILRNRTTFRICYARFLTLDFLEFWRRTPNVLRQLLRANSQYWRHSTSDTCNDVHLQDCPHLMVHY